MGPEGDAATLSKDMPQIAIYREKMKERAETFALQWDSYNGMNTNPDFDVYANEWN